MPNNNQQREHRRKWGDKGDIPRDDVPEVFVVDFRVRSLNRLIDGVVGELRRNR